MVEVERNHAGWSSWNTARHAASDRKQWKENVKALCASWHGENYGKVKVVQQTMVKN